MVNGGDRNMLEIRRDGTQAAVRNVDTTRTAQALSFGLALNRD
jgi:hypothetical protein